MYFTWAKEYSLALKQKRPQARLYGYRIKLHDQLEYVKLYLGHLMLDGKTRATLNRINNFLNLQKINSKGGLEIHFVGGSPSEVVVHVNNLKEIDFADTHGLVGYDSIFILRRDKPWTQKSVDAFTEAIRDDLKFDGSNFDPASIDISNRDEENELAFIDCNID
jgi:hypothetical protein